MCKLVDEDSYDYRGLKEKYPEESVFYSWSFEGDNYNRGYTEFYDHNKNFLITRQHEFYG